MAIFSLHHSFIGRTTHKPGAASLFARYITRPEACTETIGLRMPTEARPLMRWLDEQEQGDRKNARVIDKLILALPAELDHEQNLSLLQNFCERMTEGRAAWMAAVHDGPEDRDNPHAHIIFRDRNIETGKRVMMTTEAGSTQRFRDAWEQEANIALDRAGFEERIDKRSLKDQGIDREPQLHVGAGAEKLREKQHEFRSVQQETTRLIDGVPTTVTVNYPAIDEGKTRWQENEDRKERNRLRELEMEGIVSAEMELQQRYYKALQDKITPPLDESDLLNWLVATHIANREREQTERDRRDDELERNTGGEDLKGKPARRGPTDMIAGGGLALIEKISDSLESILDGPKISAKDERDMTMAEKEQAQAVRTEIEQRNNAQEYEKWRKAELQAMLDQRAKERGIERGR